MSSTGKPPVGSFGRRKAISRAESAATQESLQSAMDLEVAIGTSAIPNDAATVQGSAHGSKVRGCHVDAVLAMRMRSVGSFPLC